MWHFVLNLLLFFSIFLAKGDENEWGDTELDFGLENVDMEVDDGDFAVEVDDFDEEGTAEAAVEVENIDSYFDAGVDAYIDADFNEDFDDNLYYDSDLDEEVYFDSDIYFDDADLGDYDYDADIVDLDDDNFDADVVYYDDYYIDNDDTHHDKTDFYDYEYDTGGENVDENAGLVDTAAYFDEDVHAVFDEHVYVYDDDNDIEFNDENEVEDEVIEDGGNAEDDEVTEDDYNAEDAEVEDTFDIEADDDITDAATVPGISAENIVSETVESVGTKIFTKNLFKSPMLAVIGVVSLVLLIINLLVCLRHQCKKQRGITTWSKVDTISSASDSEENELL